MRATEPECILIINDSSILHEWLVQELRAENYDAVTTDTGERAFLVLKDWQNTVGWPGLIACNLRMPDMGGFELLRLVAAARPPFVFVSRSNERNRGLVRRQCGSDDYPTNPIDLGMLGIVSENQLLHRFDSSGSPSENGLTGRQREVLTWVGRGKTSSEVAIILGLSERTINFHCNHAVKRLDVANRTQAVAKAIAQGLIPS